MSSHATHTDTRVPVTRLVRGLVGMAPDVLSILNGARTLALVRPDTRLSLGRVFEKLAQSQPGHPFLRFEDRTYSYGDANAIVNRYAAALSRHGAGPGTVVGVLAENRPETLFVTIAAVKLGAAAGLLNHNQRGDVLAHSLRLLDSVVLVAGAECAEALASLPEGSEPARAVLGLAMDGQHLADHPDLGDLAAGESPANPPACADIPARATAFYVFTSGTTGLPKASKMSHFRWLKGMAGLGQLGVRLRGDDVLYCCLPLYHNNALTVSLSSVLGAGATFALSRKFSVSRFWSDVRHHDTTAFCYIGELCRYLLNQPEQADDRNHKVRIVVGNGLRPEIWHRFKSRFGIPRIAEFYGASECNIAFVNVFNVDETAGFCPLAYAVVSYDQAEGKPLRGPDGRLTRVAVGEIGLLISKVTARAPFDGYTDDVASQRKLIRNAFGDGDVWFDTGDLVRHQGFRHVSFVDRLGDTFRWKGENVATTEVEAALTGHPSVEGAVVYGVTVPGADGRAGMAAVKLREGESFDGAGLAKHLFGELPAYAMPLFIRLVDQIETTSTFKSRKVELQDEAYDASRVSDPLFALAGRDEGFREAYDGYTEDVVSGKFRPFPTRTEAPAPLSPDSG
jgi:fatty-acyl-CoA synthase